MNTMKFFKLVLFIFSSAILTGQSEIFVLDTTWSNTRLNMSRFAKVIRLNGNKLLVVDKEKAKIFDNYLSINDVSKKVITELDDPIINFNGLLCQLNSLNEIEPLNILNFVPIFKFAAPENSVKLLNDRILYQRNDSIFLYDVKINSNQFVHFGGTGEFISENQLLIRQDGNKSYYSLSLNNLFVAPKEGDVLYCDNSFMVTRSYDDEYGALYNIYDITSTSYTQIGGDYDDYEINLNNDGIILKSSISNEISFITSLGGLIPLSNTLDLDTTHENDIFTKKTTKGKYLFIDNFGERVSDKEYDKIQSGIYQKEFIVSRDDSIFIMKPGHGEIIGGIYDNIKHIKDGKYLVINGDYISVIDSMNREVIPKRIGDTQSFHYRNYKGNDLLMFDEGNNRERLKKRWGRAIDTVSVYSINGDYLFGWNRKVESDFVYSKHPTTWSFGLNSISELDNSILSKLNPDNEWMISEKINGKIMFRLIRNDSTPLTNWYKRIRPLKKRSHYSVLTKGNKFGIIRCNLNK